MNNKKYISLSIDDAKAEYLQHDTDKWRLAFFDKTKGGYLVVAKRRIEQGNVNKQEQAKYAKEYAMCQTLAENGYRVEYLEIKENSFDVYLNGVNAELKKTAGGGNVVKYAKKALREQGAEIIVFEFDSNTKKIQEELDKLKRMGIKVCYYFTNDKKIHRL
ncbi:hypothetical protein FACS1894156_3300 [Bacteroidia bacterium]|nr:hypothetical protein FACS1894156_3300 [Bacteroidia bacterium]